MSTNDPQAICGTCRFWQPLIYGGDPQPENRDGDCRFDPPRAVISESGYHAYAFPSIPEKKWCGKHELSDVEQSKREIARLQAQEP